MDRELYNKINEMVNLNLSSNCACSCGFFGKVSIDVYRIIKIGLDIDSIYSNIVPQIEKMYGIIL